MASARSPRRNLSRAGVAKNRSRTSTRVPGAPAAGAGEPAVAAPSLSERDQMLAARLDRLKQDQGLLALLLGQDGQSSSGFGGAFSPRGKEST